MKLKFDGAATIAACSLHHRRLLLPPDATTSNDSIVATSPFPISCSRRCFIDINNEPKGPSSCCPLPSALLRPRN
ncbi:hypothetical protein P3S68_022370 [Capsicum galapagoense]